MSKNALELVTGDIWSARDAFEAVLVDRSINFEREAGFAIQILQANDYSLKLAAGARQSIVDAVTNIAAIGISLNPALKQAYLIPRDGKITLDISYMGLIELAVGAKAILWGQANLVHLNDEFFDNGAGHEPTHRYRPFSRERGEVVGAYCVAKIPSGDYLTEILDIERLNAIRDRSESWKKGQKGPWKTDWAAMARKSAVKAASKWWRGRGNNERLDKVIEYLNAEGEGFAPLHDAAVPQVSGFDVDGYIAQARAQKNEADLVKVHAEAMGVAEKAGDRDGARRFRDAALARRAVLRNTIDMDHREAA